MFTLVQWIVLVIVFLFLFGIAFVIWLDSGDAKFAIISFLVILIIMVVLGIVLNWYNTSTASGIRGMKDHKSNLSNGIDREITITAEDGREIFYYEGKVDVESNHEDNYIKFESEEGKRYIIYYGIQDTIKIIEK